MYFVENELRIQLWRRRNDIW